jgi:hypothetical protein
VADYGRKTAFAEKWIPLDRPAALFRKPHFATASQTGYDEVTVCMRPILKRISTIDGGDPARYAPEDANRFAQVLRFVVGPSSGDGEESFDLTVCTPVWLQDRCEREGFVIGRHHLVVLAYDFEFIRRTLVRLVERYSGATWQEVATKVSRMAYWEFEDYAQADEGG